MPSTRTRSHRGLRAVGSAASALLLASLVALTPAVAHAAPAGDDFNRANGPLGASWTTVLGDMSLVGGRVAGTDNSASLLNGASGTRVSVDAYSAPGGVSYVALLGGYTHSGAAYFAKVQDNSLDGTFDVVYVYNGANGQNPVAAALPIAPTAQARISLTMTGTSGVFAIDRDLDGTPDESFPVTFPGAADPAAGIGLYGASRADNFLVDATPVALAAPATLTTTAGSGTLSVSADAGGSAPAGDVTLTVDGQPAQTLALDAGTASFDLAALPAGTHSSTVRFLGGGGYEPAQKSGSIAVAAVATSTSLTASPMSIAAGGTTVLTATVTASGLAATGFVEFWDGISSLGMAEIEDGVATFEYTATTAGPHIFTASYLGSATHLSSPAQGIVLNVAAAPTTTTVTVSAPAVTVGDPVTATATVTASGITPGGSVEFFDGTTSLGTAVLTGGSVDLVLPSLDAGTHSLTVRYAGSTDAAESVSEVAEVEVARFAATLALEAPTRAQAGEPVTLRATVASASAPATPTGSVEFFAGEQSLGTAQLVDGVAELRTELPAGRVALSAVYSGSATIASATASATVQVAAAPLLSLTGADASVWPYGAALLLVGAVLIGFTVRRRARA